MRAVVVGGGPGGLFFSYLWKKRHPEFEVLLFEQNAADVTWGFGVVFSDRALDFLRADHPEVVDFLSGRMEHWRILALTVRGQRIEIDGVGFSAIGRLDLLRLLQGIARNAGVKISLGTPVQSIIGLADADVVVGADGLTSWRGWRGRIRTSRQSSPATRKTLASR